MLLSLVPVLIAVPGCPEQVPRGRLLRAGPGSAAEPGGSTEALPAVSSCWEQAGPGETAGVGAGAARYRGSRAPGAVGLRGGVTP